MKLDLIERLGKIQAEINRIKKEEDDKIDFLARKIDSLEKIVKKFMVKEDHRSA